MVSKNMCKLRHKLKNAKNLPEPTWSWQNKPRYTMTLPNDPRPICFVTEYRSQGLSSPALANGGGSRVAAGTAVHTNVSECAMNDHSPSLLRSILFSCCNRSSSLCSSVLAVCVRRYIRLPICANNSLSQINPAAAAPVNAALGCSPDSLAT